MISLYEDWVFFTCLLSLNTLCIYFREHFQIFYHHEFPFLHFLGKSAILCILWNGAVYTFIRALDPALINAADVYAIYSTYYCYYYVLSWIVLFELFVAARVSYVWVKCQTLVTTRKLCLIDRQMRSMYAIFVWLLDIIFSTKCYW